MKQADIFGFAQALGLSPTQEQLSALTHYEDVLRTRGLSLGLVSKADRHRIRERHILDCMRAAEPAPTKGVAYDLGSGGGLPGIVIAIFRPELAVTLVERRSRRAGFLEWVSQDLGLDNVEVAACGIEELAAQGANACFARALAPLPESWEFARALLRSDGILVYFAGKGARTPGPLPGATSVEVLASEMLESAGPLVIITR